MDKNEGLKLAAYTDQRGRVRDGFYPSPHNKITRPKLADASIPPLLIPGNTTRLLGIVNQMFPSAGADPQSDGTMGEPQGL